MPPGKTGVYMGIFNFFIVLPEILAALVLGKVMVHLNNNRFAAVVAGGASLAIAALLMLRGGRSRAMMDSAFAPWHLFVFLFLVGVPFAGLVIGVPLIWRSGRKLGAVALVVGSIVAPFTLVIALPPRSTPAPRVSPEDRARAEARPAAATWVALFDAFAADANLAPDEAQVLHDLALRLVAAGQADALVKAVGPRLERCLAMGSRNSETLRDILEQTLYAWTGRSPVRRALGLATDVPRPPPVPAALPVRALLGAPDLGYDAARTLLLALAPGRGSTLDLLADLLLMNEHRDRLSTGVVRAAVECVEGTNGFAKLAPSVEKVRRRLEALEAAARAELARPGR